MKLDEVAHDGDDLTQFKVLYDQKLGDLIEGDRRRSDDHQDDQDPGTDSRALAIRQSR